MKSIKDISLCKNATIKKAMEVINRGAIRIALVIEDRKLIGTLADGDIRRALLNGYGFDDGIEDIINRKPIVCNLNETKDQMIQKAIKHKVYQLPIVDKDGNVLDIKEVDSLINSNNYKNRVVLMAGGLGTRLRPLTNRVPKPLLKVGGKPILEIIIENFAKQGFKDFLLSVNYKSDMFIDYFGDGSRWGVNIEYIHEDKRMGTAGALSLMRDKLEDDFFVMNGDLLTLLNFEELLKFHKQNSATATMCVREYDMQIPYGVIESKDEKIVSIREKPIHHFSVNTGIYMLNPKVLKLIPDNCFYDMPTLFEKLLETEEAFSYKVEDYWLDIGKMDEYERAQNEYDEVFEKELEYA